MRTPLMDKRLPQFEEGELININNNRLVEFIRWENLYGKVIMWLKNEQGNEVGYGNEAIKTIFNEPFDTTPIEKDLWRDKILDCLIFDNKTSNNEILLTITNFMNDAIQKKLVHKVFNVTHDELPVCGIVFVANGSTQAEANQYFREKVAKQFNSTLIK